MSPTLQPGGRLVAALGAAAALAACGAPAYPTALPPGLVPPFAGYSSATYADPARWLCRPDLPTDPCRGDLTTVEIRPDGTLATVPHVPHPAPEVDCFYLYPTVDLRVTPGNHDDFSDLAPMTRATLAQAARFTEACALYVPLYRQVTIGTYFSGKESRDRRLAVAFSDVADAFLHYMANYNEGRKVVIMGHSQGAEMAIRLLARFFDGDPVMRERLLLAMPIGGILTVPVGRLVGGTFANLPLCSRPGERGCVIAYRSHRDGRHIERARRLVPPPGSELACVNPASVGNDERRRFSRTIFPVSRHSGKLRGLDGVTAPFAMMRDFYAGRCFTDPAGHRYLAIEEGPGPGDARSGVIDLDESRFTRGDDFHGLDMTFPQGDLVNLVSWAAAAR